METLFHSITSHFSKNLPFVVYQKPNSTKVCALFQDDAIVNTTNTFTESGFVFAPFDDKKKVILIPNHSYKEEVVTFPEITPKIEHASNDISEERAAHIKLVSKGVHTILDKSNVLEKVVLSRAENMATTAHPIALFQELRVYYPTAFTYLWHHPKVGTWLGATPETLLSVDGKRFKTMSLAGTKSYEGTTEVTWTAKEIHEQQIVTDFIVNELQDDVQKVTVLDTETHQAGKLLHLKTTILGVLHDQKDIKKIIETLHPTPAVCGFPKSLAKEFILAEEGYDRAFYTGFLGELNMKKTISRNRNTRNQENSAYKAIKNVSNIYVNLRCMQLQDDSATIYIGGGITKDSDPESEWKETVAKAEIMKQVL